jgi:hypothetical protein
MDHRISNAHAAHMRCCRFTVLSYEWTDALLALRSGALHLNHLAARSLGAPPHHLPEANSVSITV